MATRKLAELTIPAPPDLCECAEGARTDGQAYSLVMPTVATEALRMTSGGKTLTITPMEMLYRGLNAAGAVCYDYIAGSAPVQVQPSGKQVRYVRTYPQTDDVFQVQPEGIKHHAIVLEPPRGHAEYIVQDAEFGFSEQMGGINLPLGAHEQMEAGGFRFGQPVARDMAGATCEGRYEVVPADDGQQPLTLFPAAWILSPDRVWPINLDPSITTTTQSAMPYSFQHKVDRFDDGTVIGLVRTGATQLEVRISNDDGLNWQTPTTGAVVHTAHDEGCIAVHEGVVYVGTGAGGGASPTSPRIWRGIVSADKLSYTWTYLTIGTNAGDDRPEISPMTVGTDHVLHVSYRNYGNSAIGYQRVTVASLGTGAMSKNTSTAITSSSSHASAVDSDSAKNVYAVGAAASSVILRKLTFSAPSTWTMGSSETVSSTQPASNYLLSGVCDSEARFMVAYVANGTTAAVVKQRAATGTLTDISPSSTTPESLAITVDDNDNPWLFYTVASSGAYYRKYDRSTGTWGAAVQLSADTTAKQINCKRKYSNDRVEATFLTGAGSPYTVNFASVVLNSAPAAPAITLASSAFAASAGTDVTITHVDTDQMGGWTWKYVLGTVERWWDNATKAFDKTSEYWNAGSGFSVTILAADLANKLTTGNIYQFYAATKDSQNAVGPYNSVGVVANVGSAPVVTITSGATANAATYTATWTTDQLQGAYQVRVLNGATEVSTTGKVTDVSARARTVALPSNGVTYTVEVTAWDQTSSGGVASTPTTISVTTSFTAVATPTISATGMSADGNIGVTWVSPTPWANTLTANQAGVETDTTGFVAYKPGVVISRDTTEAWNGAASLKTVTPGSIVSEGFYLVGPACAVGDVFTVSLYLKGTGTVQVRMHRDGATLLGHTTMTLTSDWQLVTLTGAPADASGNIRIYVWTPTAQAITFYADGLMVETGSTAHDWILGGTQSTPTCSYVDLYRNGVRIATQLPASGSYADYNVASGSTYTYYVKAVGENATTADSATASASVTLTGIWLHDAADPATTAIKLQYHPRRGEDWQPDLALMQYAGRTRPVAEFGTNDDGRYRFDVVLTSASAQWPLLKALVQRKATVCARDSSGRRVFGVIPRLPEQDEIWGGQTVSLEVIETAYAETV